MPKERSSFLLRLLNALRPESAQLALTAKERVPRLLRVFLCHSSGDKEAVRVLYNRLKGDGIDPWFDEEKLVGGQDWEKEISKAVRGSDVVVICLSRYSVAQQSYVQKEIQDALDIAGEQPEDTIFLIPLKLEECDVPWQLKRLQWINLFEEAGYERLLKSLQYRIHTLSLAVSEHSLQAESTSGSRRAADELRPTFAVPLAIVTAPELTPLVDENTKTGALFRAELPKLRSAIYYDLGVILPDVFVSGNAPLKPRQYFIAVKEVPVVYGSIPPDCVYVNDSADNIRVFGIDGEDLSSPADLKPGAWIPASQRPVAEMAGLKVWEPAEVITLHLSLVLRKYAHDFIGIQESQALLDFVSQGAPKLVDEVVPRVVTIHQLTDILQRLVKEGISIRDLKSILDSLSEWGRIEKDPVMLTEYVRSSMKRYISFHYTRGRDTLYVYLLDPEIEDVIRGAIRRTATGTFLSLDPDITFDILECIRREFASVPLSAQKPVLITDMELRRFIRNLIELEFPGTPVLSYQELAPELNVQVVGRISLGPPKLIEAAGDASGEGSVDAGE